jgi:hypothetical protein
MKEVATLNFIEFDSKDEACIIIRATRDLIAICFSLKEDGDAELVLSSEEWRTFLVQFERALAIAEATDN